MSSTPHAHCSIAIYSKLVWDSSGNGTLREVHMWHILSQYCLSEHKFLWSEEKWELYWHDFFLTWDHCSGGVVSVLPGHVSLFTRFWETRQIIISWIALEHFDEFLYLGIFFLLFPWITDQVITEQVHWLLLKVSMKELKPMICIKDQILIIFFQIDTGFMHLSDNKLTCDMTCIFVRKKTWIQ